VINRDKYTEYKTLRSKKLKHAANIIDISKLKLVTDVGIDNSLLVKGRYIWLVKIEKTKPIYDIQKHSVNKFLNFIELQTGHKLSSNLFKLIDNPSFLKLIKHSKLPIYYKELYYNFKDIVLELNQYNYTIVFNSAYLSNDTSYNYMWNFVGKIAQKKYSNSI